MKIAIIHQYYLMAGAPGGSRFNAFAEMWAKAGHEVTVIAGNLDYATGTIPERYRGKIMVEEFDGRVRVLRCAVPASYSRGYLGRMWAFAGFTFSAAWATFFLKRPDIVIATSPPLVAVIPAWLTRLRWHPPRLVFEIRDLMPESAVTTGVLSATSPLTRLLYLVERLACRWAHRINVLTPAFRENLLRRGLADDDKLLLISNGADLAHFTPGHRDNAYRRAQGWGEQYVAMYAGAHGRANALHQLVDAARHLRHRPDILIACVGDGPERAGLEAMVRAEGLTNIVFHGAVAKSAISEVINACDVGLAVLQDNPTFKTVYPNKIFDYMACARPIVLGVDGVARQLVCDDAQSGIFAQPEDGKSVATAIQALADDRKAGDAMGQRGRAWAEENVDRRVLADRYLEALQQAVGA